MHGFSLHANTHARHIYVDETDDKARAAAEPTLRYFFSLWNRGFNDAASRAGAAQPQIRTALNTEHSFAYFREGNRERVNFHPLSWADLDKTGFIIAGSPDAVARKLKQQMHQVSAEHFMGMFHIGNLAHDKVISSLNLFHREVILRL
jgi:alkanesulfonate monooxygenase SsuD/methylene tetrahydromethanopterin reductase-like flavin-dependent oxidoreductase (luciferase family)